MTRRDDLDREVDEATAEMEAATAEVERLMDRAVELDLDLPGRPPFVWPPIDSRRTAR